jgi:hypothetical protein
MKSAWIIAALAVATPALAQGVANAPTSAPEKAPAAAPEKPSAPPVLLLRGLDKITGRPKEILAPMNVPVKFATFVITARFCYSTPQSETPQTSAFVQIEDHRPDQPPKQIFSGWMYASNPGLNAVQHPLYDVWVIRCITDQPGQAPAVVSSKEPEKVKAPQVNDKEAPVALPEEAGQ